MGEAQAKMQSSIAEAKAEMERMESKLMNDTEIAHFKRDYDFKKAGYDVEVNTAKANADLAYTLQVCTGQIIALFIYCNEAMKISKILQ